MKTGEPPDSINPTLKSMTNDEWLKEQCSRYNADGFCSLTNCLRLGGRTEKASDPVDYTLATCHAHEVFLELEELRALQVPVGCVVIDKEALVSLRRSASPVTDNPLEEAFYRRIDP